MEKRVTCNKFVNVNDEKNTDAKEIEYLFSPVLPITGVKSVHLFEEEQLQGFQDYATPLQRTDPKYKIRHDQLSWNSEDDFIPHEIISNDYEDSDFSSSSSLLSSFEEQSWKPRNEKEETVLYSNWAKYALDVELWKDAIEPVIEFPHETKNYRDESGILSENDIKTHSSFLTKSPENSLFILGKCELQNMELSDITVLRNHHYLQYLDLSHNYLTDLTPLGDLPYLIYLDASHNKLRTILSFNPPWYLTEVNLSHNNISEMNDISGFWSIVRLDLSHNSIETIDGLQNLKYLKYLNLSYNLIERVENIDKLNIEELNLDFNCITTFKLSDPEGGIKSLTNLRILILSHNRIKNLEFFKGVYSLRYIDLRFNRITDLMEVSHLKSSVYEVDLRGNPCVKWPNYKDVLLSSMPTAAYIDGSEVSTLERVSAITSLAPTIDLTSAQTITKLFFLEQLNLSKVDERVTPYDEATPPLIILCGPSAVKKVALALKLVEKAPKRVRFCRSHTTRESPENEEDAEAHIFIKREEFNEMTRRGEFLSIQDLLGHSYGFHVSEIAKIYAEKKVGISQMDLHATIQIYNRYPNTKVVLVLTKDNETHREWIGEKFNVFTWLKDSVEDLLAVKIGRRPTTCSCESLSSEENFVSLIIHDVIDKLELPPYNPCLDPKRTGIELTDIILKSKNMHPKVIKMKEDKFDEKRITFLENIDYEESDETTDPTIEENKLIRGGLRVILDEKSNIIIDDKETKKRRHKAKVLFERTIMEMKGIDTFEEESEGSLTSEDSNVKLIHKRIEAQDLKEIYIESVMKSRELYINQHQNNPGFFSLVLFSGHFKKSFDSLYDFVYQVYVNQKNAQPLHHYEIDSLKHKIIPAKIESIAAELKKNLSTVNIKKQELLKTQEKCTRNQPLI